MSVPAPYPSQKPLLRGASFEADGAVVIEYCEPTRDAKANGVLINHTLYIPSGADYDDEIAAVLDAVHALLADVQEDLPLLEPARLPADDDDDSDDDEDDEEDEEDEDGERDGADE